MGFTLRRIGGTLDYSAPVTSLDAKAERIEINRIRGQTLFGRVEVSAREGYLRMVVLDDWVRLRSDLARQAEKGDRLWLIQQRFGGNIQLRHLSC